MYYENNTKPLTIILARKFSSASSAFYTVNFINPTASMQTKSDVAETFVGNPTSCLEFLGAASRNEISPLRFPIWTSETYKDISSAQSDNTTYYPVACESFIAIDDILYLCDYLFTKYGDGNVQFNVRYSQNNVTVGLWEYLDGVVTITGDTDNLIFGNEFKIGGEEGDVHFEIFIARGFTASVTEAITFPKISHISKVLDTAAEQDWWYWNTPLSTCATEPEDVTRYPSCDFVEPIKPIRKLNRVYNNARDIKATRTLLCISQ